MAFIPIVCQSDDQVRVGDEIVIEQSDIRMVNGIRTDLRPLHQWLRSPQGDRPLKMWKQIQVFTWKGKMFSSYDQCVIKNEQGDFAELYIANLPAQIAGQFVAMKDYEAKIAALQRQIDTEKPAAERANATALVSIQDRRDIVDARMNERLSANLAMQAVKEKTETLLKWQVEYKALKDQAQTSTKVVVIFTGKKWGQLQVADCGIRLDR